MKNIKAITINIVAIIEKDNRLPLHDSGKDFTVDICHGSPGAIPFLTTALQVFPDMQT